MRPLALIKHVFPLEIFVDFSKTHKMLSENVSVVIYSMLSLFDCTLDGLQLEQLSI